MSFQTAHTWIEGARLPTGVELATCSHCGTLRTTAPAQVTFLALGDANPQEVGEPRRLPAVLDVPPCVSPPPWRRAPW